MDIGKSTFACLVAQLREYMKLEQPHNLSKELSLADMTHSNTPKYVMFVLSYFLIDLSHSILKVIGVNALLWN